MYNSYVAICYVVDNTAHARRNYEIKKIGNNHDFIMLFQLHGNLASGCL